ncbi:MAG: S49 family peptidase [Actinomycetia bacterium]|nr:S49 family peptidase [Actinomycetes bacterium]
MPNWNKILNEINTAGSTYDVIRKKYLQKLYKITGRNIIIYYSGWLQKPNAPDVQVNDADKNGFMTVIHKLDRKKGLDLLLHTPGGETAAMESLVDYLHSMFDTNIRAIIPQLALSAGTMIACACKEIIMGRHSSLGPIDPQFKGVPAHGVVEEFNRAYKEIKNDPAKAYVWQPIISKYSPTLIGECEKAIEWSEEMVKEWLLSGMLKDVEDAENVVKNIIKELGDHALNKSHARHLSAEKCKEIGLKVVQLEDDDILQDAVLSVHHSCIHTLSATNAFKIIENHKGIAFIQSMQQIIVKR